MGIGGTIVAVIVALVLAWALFLGAALVDEDANHWDWTRDDGPGPLVTAVHAVGAVAAAGLLVTGPAIAWARREAVWLLLTAVGIGVASFILRWPGRRFYARQRRGS